MADILVVEDDLDNQTLIFRMLELNQHTVTTACNGQEALYSLMHQRPDIILMDMSMPALDGWRTAAVLKADPYLADIPVIAITAHAHAEDAVRAFQAGCNGYLAKPIDYFQLIELVDSHLQPV